MHIDIRLESKQSRWGIDAKGTVMAVRAIHVSFEPQCKQSRVIALSDGHCAAGWVWGLMA